MGAVSRVNAYRRRHRWAGLPLAVLYEFTDDQGSYLAAQITYYGVVSLFPLLLLATFLGYGRQPRGASVRLGHRRAGTGRAFT